MTSVLSHGRGRNLSSREGGIRAGPGGDADTRVGAGRGVSVPGAPVEEVVNGDVPDLYRGTPRRALARCLARISGVFVASLSLSLSLSRVLASEARADPQFPETRAEGPGIFVWRWTPVGGGVAATFEHRSGAIWTAWAAAGDSRALLSWLGRTGFEGGHVSLLLTALDGASGAIPRSLVGVDGLSGTADDLTPDAVVRPGTARSRGPAPSRHACREATVRTAPPLGPLPAPLSGDGISAPQVEVVTSVSGEDGGAFAVCLRGGERSVLVPGVVPVDRWAEALGRCPDPDLIWLAEGALGAALVSRTWLDALPAETSVLLTPDGTGRCGPSRAALRALGGREVLWLRPTARSLFDRCGDRMDGDLPPSVRTLERLVLTEGTDADTRG